MKKPNSAISSFASEAEERAYWERTDSAAHRDWSRTKPARLPNLQPSKTAMSLRLPVSLLEAIKIAADKREAPCQAPIGMWLSEKAG